MLSKKNIPAAAAAAVIPFRLSSPGPRWPVLFVVGPCWPALALVGLQRLHLLLTPVVGPHCACVGFVGLCCSLNKCS
jgi:hypothetical protein